MIVKIKRMTALVFQDMLQCAFLFKGLLLSYMGMGNSDIFEMCDYEIGFFYMYNYNYFIYQHHKKFHLNECGLYIRIYSNFKCILLV